ncbi:MAG: hypothetical protein ACYCVB_08320 [Bacilli bacterium]
MRKGIWSAMAAVLLVGAASSPALADGHAKNGSSGWMRKEQRLQSGIASTLQTFVPKVESAASTLVSQLGGQSGTTVTGSVYLPTSVTADVSTIQADAALLQTLSAPQLLKQLQKIEVKIERTKSALNRLKEHASESAKGMQHELAKLNKEDAQFEQSVSDLKAAYQTLAAGPASHAVYNAANRVWKNVLHEGKKIEEWSHEWSSANGGS